MATNNLEDNLEYVSGLDRNEFTMIAGMQQTISDLTRDLRRAEQEERWWRRMAILVVVLWIATNAIRWGLGV